MAMAALPALSTVGAAAGIAGAGLGAYSAYQTQKYQAGVAQNNASIANANATNAIQAGQSETENVLAQNDAKMGMIRASIAANGFEGNSGSPLDIQRSAGLTGAENADTTQNNYNRQALAFENQSINSQDQASVFQQGENTAVLGGITQGATLAAAYGSTPNLLADAGSVSSKWNHYSGGGTGSGLTSQFDPEGY